MDVNLPKLGEGADAGVVVSLFVKEGDQIEEGQTIIELENEKAVAPISSTVSGTVTKIRVKEGDKISIGQVILTVDTGGAETKPAQGKGAVADEGRPMRSRPVEHEDHLTEEAPAKS